MDLIVTSLSAKVTGFLLEVSVFHTSCTCQQKLLSWHLRVGYAGSFCRVWQPTRLSEATLEKSKLQGLSARCQKLALKVCITHKVR